VITFLIIVLWLSFGFVGYAIELGYFTKRYPYHDHNPIGLLAGCLIFGPISALAAFIMWGPYFRVRPLTKEQRWNAFNEMFPSLGRSYFERDHG